jgi:nicotinamidase-related amidase
MLKENHVCEEGTWGAQIYEGLEPDLANGDIVVAKHWNARRVLYLLYQLERPQILNCRSSNFSSFSNTDLDYRLRQRNITKVVTAGMTCNQCLELTSRTAIELGYDVTVA